MALSERKGIRFLFRTRLRKRSYMGPHRVLVGRRGRREEKRIGKGREEKERREKERREKERREKERLERERKEVEAKERQEKMERDRQRLGREELDRREMERKEEREKAEKAEKERIRKEVERREEERLERERMEFEQQLLSQHSRRSSLERSPPTSKKKFREEKRSEESATCTEGGETTEEENKKRKSREEESPPKMKKKTRNVKTQEEEEEEEEPEVMKIGEEEKAPEKKIELVIKKMEGWLEKQARLKTVSKVQLGEMVRLVGEIRKEVKEMELEKAKLEGRVEERREIVGMLREMVREGGKSEGVGRVEEGVSFAEIVREEKKKKVKKKNPVVTGTGREPVRALNVVIVRKEGKESEEVRKEMKEAVDPRKEGINVRRMMKIKNGIALELGSKEEAKKMVESEGMKRAGMEVREPVRKRPMVMLYDVEVSLTNEEVLREIHERNLKEEFTEEEMKDEFRIRNRIVEGKGDRRKKLGSLDVECSGRMRNALRVRERVYVGWTSSRVKDYIDLLRCYKCQRFGHVAKFCNSKKACRRCSEEHDIRECRKAEDATWKCEPYSRGGRVLVPGARVLQDRKLGEEQVWAAVAVLDERVEAFGRDEESDDCCMVVDVRMCEWEVTVVSVYCKGQEDIRTSLEKLRRVLRRRRGRRVFIAGDFNAKSEVWFARDLNERGERVEEFVVTEGLEVMNEASEWSTFEDTRGRVSNIDITMATVDISRIFTGWQVQAGLISDHRMVVSEVRAGWEGVGREVENPKRWNLRKANWNRFRQVMEEEKAGWEESRIEGEEGEDNLPTDRGELGESCE
ncbi:golgin subfamily A member 6-like protein 22 [Homalodisca vitripennis]|uniref:golgin subfamily A member 6-like protein 22 n=1 Tax=Homalodisca vitripennis TaxID=197043 RepID=UPI001EEA9ECA|nr:golgin subfamily A member 6-like protein 22 [Homalodisca vitripennis]